MTKNEQIWGYPERFLREGEANSLEELNTSVRALYELIGGVKEVLCE